MNKTPNQDAAEFGLTVVIPAYNYAHFLPYALDSVLNQDYPEIDVIVVDDGSTDNTRDVVAGYGPRVRYIYQDNAGLPAARNTGILNARQPFVGFLDADDGWLPHLASRILDRFKTLPADFVLVAGKSRKMDVKGNVLPQKRLDFTVSGELTLQDMIMRSQFAPSAVIVRRQVFDHSGLFDVTLKSSEDRDMWIRIRACGRIYVLPEPVILYRVHPGSMSRNAQRMKNNTQMVLRKARTAGLVSSWNLLFWLKVYSFQYFQSAWMFHDQGDSGKAILEILLSLVLWPWYRQPRKFNEPVLFRLRALFRFIQGACRGFPDRSG